MAKDTHDNRWAMLVIVFLLISCLAALVSGTSYTSDGQWLSPPAEKYCTHFMCSPSNLTWVPDHPQLIFFDNNTACDMLIKKGIKEIFFHGDSYMRQMYAAMLITLNGDFQYGTQADPTKTPHCAYHRQFYEKACGTYQMNHGGQVCGGKLHLEPFLNNFDRPDFCAKSNGSVVLWSFGNHKLYPGNGGRIGVNNATEHAEFFEKDICRTLKVQNSTYTGVIGPTNTCSVWWVSTHYRVVGWFDDETVERVKGFNEGMRHYFDSKGCGFVNYIDVYNMTRRLTENHLKDAESMTYDKVHWGMEVNLIKAQIIINALLSQNNEYR